MRGHYIFGIILVLIGFSILFRFPVFSLFIAIVFIWIGIRAISGKGHDNHYFETKGAISEDFVRRVLIFSGINAKLSSKNFKGGDLLAIFGGGEIDARELVAMGEDINFEILSIFGGIKLRVPKNWKVENGGIGIVGAFNNYTQNPSKSSVTLHVKGTAIFGGVEITN